jgi:integrase
VATFCVTGIREGEAVALTMASLEGTPGARRLQVAGKAGKTRAIPIEGGLEEVLEAYVTTGQARFEHHDLDHPATPLFVNVRGRGLSVHQVKYLIERLYVRAGLRARVPAGALVHALRHTFGHEGLLVVSPSARCFPTTAASPRSGAWTRTCWPAGPTTLDPRRCRLSPAGRIERWRMPLGRQVKIDGAAAHGDGWPR